MVFDLLYRAGRDQTQRPPHECRRRLEKLVAGSERVFPVRRLAANGLEAWEQVRAAGYEGYVAKDESSKYEGGRLVAISGDQRQDRTCAASSGSSDEKGAALSSQVSPEKMYARRTRSNVRRRARVFLGPGARCFWDDESPRPFA